MKHSLRVLLAFLMFAAPILAAESSSPLLAQNVLRLRVIDNLTLAPIHGAEVFLQEANLSMRKIGETANGVFSLTFTNVAHDFYVEVVAPQHLKYQSGLIRPQQALPPGEIPLERTEHLRGLVVAPTGQFVEGAKAILTRRASPPDLTLQGKLINFENDTVQTSSEGGFDLAPEPWADGIFVVHELGIARVSLIGWTNGTSLRLQPWVQLGGRMLINGLPAANETIVLTSQKAPPYRSPVILHGFEIATDEQGRFFLPNVPPGELEIAWKFPGAQGGFIHSHATTVLADARRPEIIFPLEGRDLTGKIRSENGAVIDANGFSGFLSNQAGNLDLGPEMPRGSSLAGIYAVQCQPDGAIRTRAIPPGNYSLLLYRQKERLRGSISVPPGLGELDLGAITVANAAVSK